MRSMFQNWVLLVVRTPGFANCAGLTKKEGKPCGAPTLRGSVSGRHKSGCALARFPVFGVAGHLPAIAPCFAVTDGTRNLASAQPAVCQPRKRCPSAPVHRRTGLSPCEAGVVHRPWGTADQEEEDPALKHAVRSALALLCIVLLLPPGVDGAYDERQSSFDPTPDGLSCLEAAMFRKRNERSIRKRPLG